jgi:hypothetical protein
MPDAMTITWDRGDVIHFAGRHRLSPALAGGSPALVSTSEAAGRCGWADFFAALDRAGLAASFDPEDAGSFKLVRRDAAAASGAAPAHARGVFAEARRFLEALRGRLPPA